MHGFESSTGREEELEYLSLLKRKTNLLNMIYEVLESAILCVCVCVCVCACASMFIRVC